MNFDGANEDRALHGHIKIPLAWGDEARPTCCWDFSRNRGWLNVDLRPPGPRWSLARSELWLPLFALRYLLREADL
jgi:hypothetical protein